MEFFRFEIVRRLRQPMVYIFTAINFLLIFGALNNDSITVGADLPNVNANAPWVAQQQVMLMTLICLLVTTAFMNTAALRDFSSKFGGILFTKPIHKFQYLSGRFFGAVTMACIPLLGVLAAVALTGLNLFGTVKTGTFMPLGYLWAILLFVIPNTLFVGAVTFSIASLTRSQVAGFVAALGLLVLYAVAGNLVNNLDSEFAAALIDPFGLSAFNFETKYWTPAERNLQYLTFANPTIGLNRLIWIAVSFAIAAFTYLKWDFATSTSSKKQDAQLDSQHTAPPQKTQPLLAPSTTSGLSILLFSIRNEVKAVMSSRVFLIILAFAILNMFGSITSVDMRYGTGNHPVTYLMIDAIRGSLYIFLGAVVMYYAGELVWRERDAHMAELYDASPIASWVAPTAKFATLCIVPFFVLTLAIAIGCMVQLSKGYTSFDLPQYFSQLLLLDWTVFVAFAGLALALQAIVNNKYLGYFAFLVTIIITTFGMGALGIENNLFIFGATPSITYTAFNGLQPYLLSSMGYTSYWMIGTALFVVIAVLFWIRGKGHTFKNRFDLAQQRFEGPVRLFSIGLLASLIGLGSLIYYHTEVMNTVTTADEYELEAAAYEKRFARFAERPMPTITAADYNINLFPHQRSMQATVTLDLQNQTSKAIDTVLFVKTAEYDYEIKLPEAALISAMSDDKTFVYALSSAMQPGATTQVVVNTSYTATGIENEVSNTDIVPNGTFINNQSLVPSIGYQPREELSEKDEREEHGLAPKRTTAKLPHGACTSACQHHYVSNDSHWVKLSATVTTSADQIAIAPGTLVQEQTNEATGRRTFRYELEEPALHFFSVLSGTYEVQREQWQAVDLEVYYLPEHSYNVEKMMRSMRTSLEVYAEAFGPYPHRQARIIEFPRYASFAQAFPGTMPYSESIGFIADLKDSTDIDNVTYVVAHEMAHQWWAHQVVGADVQGSRMLSETFAQYSALLIQEQFYGKPQMRKFLDYELDRYLRGRARERRAERPLLLDEGAGYVHYNKGSVVMYALAEYIGRDSINGALRSLLDAYRGNGATYPTSRDFVQDHLRPRVPDSLKYLITDWIEHITLYDNKATEAFAKTNPDGTFEVSFTVDVQKLRSDSLGNETALPIAGDYIDVAILGAAEEGSSPASRTLWGARIKFDKAGKQDFTVSVNDRPEEVAIDPNLLLIDRHTDDNHIDIEFND